MLAEDPLSAVEVLPFEAMAVVGKIKEIDNI
jgi:hypothetical protein